jgi:peptide-methionine (S)-S-oxide reductase
MHRRSFLFGALAALVLAVAPSAHAQQTATAVLAGGCFWCVEQDMMELPGVIDTVSGYAGGTRRNPTYNDYNFTDRENPVSHIEVVRVTYDPAKVDFATLIAFFLRKIDPTDDGGQFCDRGLGYRPAVFVADERERAVVTEKLAEAQKIIGLTMKVEVLPAAPFWQAEEYHQDFAQKNPIRYKTYRYGCGRDARIRQVWKTN